MSFIKFTDHANKPVYLRKESVTAYREVEYYPTIGNKTSRTARSGTEVMLLSADGIVVQESLAAVAKVLADNE